MDWNIRRNFFWECIYLFCWKVNNLGCGLRGVAVCRILLALILIGASALSPVAAHGSGSSAYYAQCLNENSYTPSAISQCRSARPTKALALPLEYKHCLNMYSYLPSALLECKSYRPQAKVAKPIEYAFCLKWWGRNNPDCKKYKP